MDNPIIAENIRNSIETMFGEAQAQDIELRELGFIPNKCHTDKFALLIGCIDNMDLFTDGQKENIQSLINKFRNG